MKYFVLIFILLLKDIQSHEEDIIIDFFTYSQVKSVIVYRCVEKKGK